MSKWWGAPGEAYDDPEHGVDAWFDVWIEEDGSVATYLGERDAEIPLATLKEGMQNCLQDLLSGRTKRIPNSRNPSTEIDLTQAVLLIRIVHQRNGELACGWGSFAAEPHLLRPLRDLAAMAGEMLSGEQVGPPPS